MRPEPPCQPLQSPEAEGVLVCCWGREQEGKGTQENSSATWLTVLGFMEMGLVSGLSIANHSDSESFLVVHALFSQDGCQREGLPKVVGHTVCPFHLSRTLPFGGSFFVPCFLPGPPVVRQLIQVVTRVPGQGGWLCQCASPNSMTCNQEKNGFLLVIQPCPCMFSAVKNIGSCVDL